MNRRDFLKQGLTVSAGLALGGLPKFTPFANANDAKWRTFEVTTRIDIADPVGAVRAGVVSSYRGGLASRLSGLVSS